MGYSPMQLAEAFIQAGELRDALAALDQQLDIQADDQIHRLRAAVLLRLGDADSLQMALTALDQIANPTQADHIQRSVILEQSGDLAGALRVLEALSPEDERRAERRVRLLTEIGDFDHALKEIRHQPRSWRWLQWEGDVLVQLGDDRMATARYGLALAQLEARHDPAVDRYLRPAWARLLLARAHAYRRLDEIDSAAEHYAAAEQLIPDDPALPFYEGLLLAQQGDLDGALALCRTAWQRAPEALRTEMQHELNSDSRYQPLMQQISS
ncbi:MAG: hypothetical protein K8L99_02665 [Anaerolineae bacterium]|nr:hypothetical protein [Anaerolineae bacterium]